MFIRQWRALPSHIKRKTSLYTALATAGLWSFRSKLLARNIWPGLVILGTLTIDTFIPQANLLGRSFWRGKSRSYWALTFDDGPDPRVTPKLLDLLDQYQIKATFFLLAQRAQKAPTLTREILARGHEIGLHGLDHRQVWRMSPWAFSRHLDQGRQILEDLLGSRLFWYRAPHGFLRFDQYILLRQKGLRLAGWTIGVWDTDEDASPEEISKRILKALAPGDILLLHDGVADRLRPQTATLKALSRVLPVVLDQGLKPVALGVLWQETCGVPRV